VKPEKYIVVDHDGDVFQIFEGSVSLRDRLSSYEPDFLDTADTARDVIAIIGDDDAEWTDKAKSVAYPRYEKEDILLKRMSVADKAVEDCLEKISELNIKVVNLANKLEAHLNEADAHNVAILHRSKK
jgi:hypothetical protein